MVKYSLNRTGWRRQERQALFSSQRWPKHQILFNYTNNHPEANRKAQTQQTALEPWGTTNLWLNQGLYTRINRENSITPWERRVFPVKYFRFSSLEIWDIPFSTRWHRKWAADCTHLTSCQACWCRKKDTRREKYYSWQTHVCSNSQPHVSR